MGVGHNSHSVNVCCMLSINGRHEGSLGFLGSLNQLREPASLFFLSEPVVLAEGTALPACSGPSPESRLSNAGRSGETLDWEP